MVPETVDQRAKPVTLESSLAASNPVAEVDQALAEAEAAGDQPAVVAADDPPMVVAADDPRPPMAVEAGPRPLMVADLGAVQDDLTDPINAAVPTC